MKKYFYDIKYFIRITIVLFAVLLVGCDRPSGDNTETQSGKDIFMEWTSNINLLLSHIVEPTFHFNEWYTADISPINPPNPFLYDYFQMSNGYWLPVTFSEVTPDIWKITYKSSPDNLFYHFTSMMFHHIYGAYSYSSGGKWETLLSDSVDATNPFLDHSFTLERPADSNFVLVSCLDPDCQFNCYVKADLLTYSVFRNSEIKLDGHGSYIQPDKSTSVNFDIIEPIVIETWNHGQSDSWPDWWITTQKANLKFIAGKVKLSTKKKNGEVILATVTIIDEKHIIVKMENIEQEWEL